MHLEVAGIDMSINMAVISMWVSSFLAFLLIFLASKRVSLVPQGRLVNLVESIVEFVYGNIIEENLGKKGKKWFPFLFRFSCSSGFAIL